MCPSPEAEVCLEFVRRSWWAAIEVRRGRRAEREEERRGGVGRTAEKGTEEGRREDRQGPGGLRATVSTRAFAVGEMVEQRLGMI